MSKNINGDSYSCTLEPTVFFFSVLSVICLIQMHFNAGYGNIFSELHVNTRQDRHFLQIEIRIDLYRLLWEK